MHPRNWAVTIKTADLAGPDRELYIVKEGDWNK